MDALLFARYHRARGELPFRRWELSAGVSNWREAPAPAQVGKRLVEGLFQVVLPSNRAQLVNNVTHWIYGMLAGVQYAIVAASLDTPRIRYGLPFGAAVWVSGYVILPAAELYEPIWRYDAKTLADDLSAHLIYGLTTATAFRAASR
jgi:hypothetical protein